MTLIASTVGAQTRIATYTPPTLPAFAGATGPFSTNAVGQGFFAPTGATSLASLTYTLTLGGTAPGGGPSSIAIFAFNGVIPTGAALFTQGFTNPTTSGTSNVTISPGIAVVGGMRYIALVSSTVSNSNFEANVYEIANSAANTTGDVFYLCFAGTTTCSVRDPGNVAAFQATFATPSAVPEPRTIFLGATGLLALALVRRRRAS